MKRRVLLLLLLPVVALLAFLYFRWRSTQLESVAEPIVERRTQPGRLPPAPPQMALVTVAAPGASSLPPIRMPRPQLIAPTRQEIPIINGATIDFSIGAPVVRSDGKDAEALDRALREMAEATKNLTFGPPPQRAADAAAKK